MKEIEKQISNNFNRNKSKFKEGIHYYVLEGEQLQSFKGCHQNDESLKYVSILYLWTKRGASRHCKMLGTDKAWEMFDSLEENYFNPKPQLTKKEELLLKLFSKDPMEVAKAHEQLVELEKRPLLETIKNKTNPI